jgi:hypothetical protein
MVIDLGEVRDGRVAAGPRSPHRGRHGALAVVAVVVALQATCGAAAPVRPVLVERTISVAPGGQMHVLGDVLFLVRGRETAGSVIVEAYRLGDEPLPPLVQEPRPVIVLDPVTGDVVADLGRWSVTSPDGDGRMVGVRHEPGTSRAVVALLDPVAARARVASVARDVVSCESHELVVACWRRDGSAVVWRPPTRNER